jgi:hypothetical protein
LIICFCHVLGDQAENKDAICCVRDCLGVCDEVVPNSSASLALVPKSSGLHPDDDLESVVTNVCGVRQRSSQNFQAIAKNKVLSWN